MKRITCLAAASLVLAACANRPETIRASFVSHERFMDLDCPALAQQLDGSRRELGTLSKAQNEKANADAAGVFLLGIPFSKLSGDFEGEIARLKGQVEAIETAQVKKRCAAAPASGGGAADTPPAAAERLDIGQAQRQIDLLRDMKDRGLLTDAEYEARRRQLADAVLAGTEAARSVPAAPAAGLVGARFKLRDEDPISHVRIGDVVLAVDAVSERGTVLNGGAIVLDAAGDLTNGSLPLPLIGRLGGGRLRPGLTVSARMVPALPAEPIDIEVQVLRTEAMRVADRDLELVRCAVSGYASPKVIAGVGLMNSAAGARIEGEIVVEPRSGLVLWAELRSVNSYYALQRRPLAADAP